MVQLLLLLASCCSCRVRSLVQHNGLGPRTLQLLRFVSHLRCSISQLRFTKFRLLLLLLLLLPRRRWLPH
jgi:hypothetical protein